MTNIRKQKFMFYITVLVLATTTPLVSYAQTLSCRFDRFYQLNNTNPSLSGYTVIDQILDIISGKTTASTLALDGSSRAANSTSWAILGKLNEDGWELFATHYVGDFGELLTIKHNLGENLVGLDGDYSASLVRSDVDRTLTSLGDCSIKRDN